MFRWACFFPLLKELVLCGLSELIHLWWNKGSFGYFSLQFLSFLTITRCDSLTYIFSLSALKGLIQLQRLQIESCALIKDIVSFENGEDTNTVVFPQLHTLRLNHLPELRSCYQDHKALDWPSLKILTIANCPNLKTFPASELAQTVDHAGNLCDTVGPFFNEKVAFPNMEELHIQYMDNLVEVWHSQLPDQTFSSLQVLDVRGCEMLTDVGPTHMLARLQMLSKLFIEDCGSVEEIFINEHGVNKDDTDASLFRLTELRLKSLPELKHMVGQGLTMRVSSLSEPNSCELVKEVVLKEDNQVEEVVLPRMRTIELKSLPKLNSFCSINGMLRLPFLQVLKVIDCPNMKIFATTLNQRNPTLGNEVSEEELSEPFFGGEIRLPMLDKLSIEDVSNSTDLWHNQLPYDSFHQLKILKVKRCEKLLRLVPELKDLKKLYVEECDSLEEILGIEQSVWGSNENHSICMLRNVKLQNLPKLVELWWNTDLNGIFNYPKFSSLKVIRCGGLKKVFSVLIVKHFIHLEEIYIANCSVMKEVVAEDELNRYAVEKVVFPQLHSLSLTLSNLPNLLSFCLGACMLEFPSLENLNLEDCPNMHTFSIWAPVTPKLNGIVLETGESLWKNNLNDTIKRLFSAKSLLLLKTVSNIQKLHAHTCSLNSSGSPKFLFL
ncbi:disease resistance protein SUMM2 [Tanacetum coccineum]